MNTTSDSKRGFIYVLVNPSVPDLLKIGKTTRSVEDRAKELSSATGVATPFMAIFHQQFNDVDAAEQYIHAVLESKGFRNASNREFFSVSPTIAIDIIIKAPGRSDEKISLPKDTTEDESLLEEEREPDDLDELFLSDEEEEKVYPWMEIYMEAKEYQFGVGDCLQDFDEALRLYIQAGKMGCPLVYRDIGDMYHNRYNFDDAPSITDKNKALEYYKQGVRNGNYYCYLSMSQMFFQDKQIENAVKCCHLFAKNLKTVKNEILDEECCLALDMQDTIYKAINNTDIEKITFSEDFLDCVRNNRQIIEESINTSINTSISYHDNLVNSGHCSIETLKTFKMLHEKVREWVLAQ